MTGTHVLSVLSPSEVAKLGGLPGQAVAGVFEGEDASPEGFRPNAAFAALMHEVIARHGPDDPELRHVARGQGEGWAYVIDLRTPEGPAGRVPPEDIIGAFEVRAGEIVDGSYTPMESHQLYTANGLVILPDNLRRALIEEIASRATGDGAQSGSGG
jgi:hypothetical protein